MSISLSALATGALSFTVALAWNDAIHKTIRSIVPISDGQAAARASLLYALVATLLVIAVVAVISGAQRAVNGGWGAPAQVSARGFAPGPPPPTIVQLWEAPAGPRW